jgi:hypothetical protein
MECYTENQLSICEDEWEKLSTNDTLALHELILDIDERISKLNLFDTGDLLENINIIYDMIEELVSDIGNGQFSCVNDNNMTVFQLNLNYYKNELNKNCRRLKTVKINKSTYFDHLCGCNV